MQGSPISPGGCTLDVHEGVLPVSHPKCVHLQWAVTKASVPFPMAGMYQSCDCCCMCKKSTFLTRLSMSLISGQLMSETDSYLAGSLVQLLMPESLQDLGW